MFEDVLLKFQAPSSRSKGLGEALFWGAHGVPEDSTATFGTQATKLGDYSRISQLASYRLTWQPAGSVACGARHSRGALDYRRIMSINYCINKQVILKTPLRI